MLLLVLLRRRQNLLLLLVLLNAARHRPVSECLFSKRLVVLVLPQHVESLLQLQLQLQLLLLLLLPVRVCRCCSTQQLAGRLSCLRRGRGRGYRRGPQSTMRRWGAPRFLRFPQGGPWGPLVF